MFGGAGSLDVLLFSILVTMMSSTLSNAIPCEDARLKCAYRSGCGLALQHYLTGCTLQGDNCTETCQHALIAVTSTDQGKELMTCECAHDDEMCKRSKSKVEICRASVTTVMNKTRVSCKMATWICNFDPLCQMALAYYNGYCKSMFKGKKCTHRCRNSISILQKQEKAAKLNNCICDGTEDYDCRGIHRNMNVLCFGKLHHDYHEVQKPVEDGNNRQNEILPDGVPGDAVRLRVDDTTLASLLLALFFLIRRD
ncbi:growth arrest-specific protein 1-like [Prorops nasuta]|uniref:growth arrest-specific protein 1-like n=1 Tax=Prorops nasuta TaxID=863751 RepID=UPI0034CFD565